MSRAQLLDRARRLALRVSLHVQPEPGPDGVRLYALVLATGAAKAELVAHVRRLAHEGVAAAATGYQAGRAFLTRSAKS